MQTFRLPRSSDAPLVFRGEMIVSQSFVDESPAYFDAQGRYRSGVSIWTWTQEARQQGRRHKGRLTIQTLGAGCLEARRATPQAIVIRTGDNHAGLHASENK